MTDKSGAEECRTPFADAAQADDLLPDILAVLHSLHSAAIAAGLYNMPNMQQ
jgi:hypothetical protein